MIGKWRQDDNEKGFTLIELTIVVAIIAILVVIAIPVYQNIVEKAAISAHNANVQALNTAGQAAITTKGNPTEEITWPSEESATGDYIDSNWLQSFPDLPANLPTAAKEGVEAYAVTLKNDGTVTVVPDKFLQ